MSRLCYVIVAIIFLLMGCQQAVGPEQTPTKATTPDTAIIETPVPPPTPTLTATSTEAPDTATPLPSTSTATATNMPTVTATAVPTVPAEVRDDGKIYLNGRVILDMNEETPGCFGFATIEPSPTNQHFIVVVGCFEGDNEAFVFNQDGSQKWRLTEKGDYLNYYEFAWSPNGRFLIYHSIYSCCISPPAGVPDSQMIRFDVETGVEASFPGSGVPDWSPDGMWLAMLEMAYPVDRIYVARGDGSEMWLLDTLDYDQGRRFVWEPMPVDGEWLLYFWDGDGVEHTYQINDQAMTALGSPVFEAVTPIPGLYQVVGVASDDVLNVRLAAGVENPIVGSLPFNAVNIEITGESVLVDGAEWVSVRYGALEGWVNRRFLAQQPM